MHFRLISVEGIEFRFSDVVVAVPATYHTQSVPPSTSLRTGETGTTTLSVTRLFPIEKSSEKLPIIGKNKYGFSNQWKLFTLMQG